MYAKELKMRERKLGTISPTFYEQLLFEKIPKAKKYNDDLPVFFCFWDLHS